MTANASTATGSTATPCCPVSTSDTHLTSNNTNNVTNINASINEDNALQSINTSLSPSSASMCTLPPAYESRIISGYPRLPPLYSSSYSDQNTFYQTHTANPFYSSFVSFNSFNYQHFIFSPNITFVRVMIL
jgi:hypothetical protein